MHRPLLVLCVIITLNSLLEHRSKCQAQLFGFRGPLSRGPLSRGPLSRGPLKRGPLAWRKPRLGWVLAPNPNAFEDDNEGDDDAEAFESFQRAAAPHHSVQPDDMGLHSRVIGFFNADGTIDHLRK
ncbi:uncharacterized protein LOC129774802 [Toxorhynchites rutilus septentrionalis]|uniref:uncharacterized protein LOC129774802 n=1 Tax=Toxorhynchites rutilus septentrionalis TaxID=329112 RepID=UPI00247A064E|nr:uncharacterized protein LOC129774802 [Toxorhynchites rutilus septentrionalis]